MAKANYEIIEKAELLRNIYFALELLKNVYPGATAGMWNVKSVIDSKVDFKFIEGELIPEIERELSEWMLKIARTTYSNQSGIIIWEDT